MKQWPVRPFPERGYPQMPVNTVVLCINITRYCQSNSSQIRALLILQPAPNHEIGNSQVTCRNSLTSITLLRNRQSETHNTLSISDIGIFLLVAGVYRLAPAITEPPLQLKGTTRGVT